MKKPYADMTAAELQAEKAALEKRYNDFKAKDLKLDMSRGKPGSDQLNLSNGLNAVSDYTENGVDLRNYGMMDGTPACKKLFADLMQVKPENVIVYLTQALRLCLIIFRSALRTAREIRRGASWIR